MKNHYQELRDRQQEEVNAFPMFFAFDQRQFAEGMRRLGLRPSDMNQVYRWHRWILPQKRCAEAT